MSAGRIYVNQGEQGEVIMDFSRTPSNVLDRGECWGFALSKTIKHLGITSEVDIDRSRMELSGSTAQVVNRAFKLHGHIGLIARYAGDMSRNTFPDFDRRAVGKTLGLLTKHLIELPPETPFMSVCSDIVEPFAEADMPGDEFLYILPNQKALWRMPADERKMQTTPMYTYTEQPLVMP